MTDPCRLPSAADTDTNPDGETGADIRHEREFLLDMTSAGVEDFVRAIFDDPSLLERLPQGGEAPPHVVGVGESAPPVDLAPFAGKTLYVHRIRPGARERYEAALAQVQGDRSDAAAD